MIEFIEVEVNGIPANELDWLDAENISSRYRYTTVVWGDLVSLVLWAQPIGRGTNRYGYRQYYYRLWTGETVVYRPGDPWTPGSLRRITLF